GGCFGASSANKVPATPTNTLHNDSPTKSRFMEKTPSWEHHDRTTEVSRPARYHSQCPLASLNKTKAKQRQNKGKTKAKQRQNKGSGRQVHLLTVVCSSR